MFTCELHPSYDPLRNAPTHTLFRFSGFYDRGVKIVFLFVTYAECNSKIVPQSFNILYTAVTWQVHCSEDTFNFSEKNYNFDTSLSNPWASDTVYLLAM